MAPFLFNGGLGDRIVGSVGAIEEGLSGEGGIFVAAAEGVGVDLQGYVVQS
jgi:hypothetical protein